MGAAALIYANGFSYTQQQLSNDQKGIVVFVHGFGSSPACWDNLINLLDEDPLIAGTFLLDRTFQYPTTWFNFSPLTRIPRLQECAEALKSHLRKAKFADYEITLVGHSMGGLVIQAYLAKAFRERNGPELKNIRQALFIATPTTGQTFSLSGVAHCPEYSLILEKKSSKYSTQKFMKLWKSSDNEAPNGRLPCVLLGNAGQDCPGGIRSRCPFGSESPGRGSLHNTNA